MPDEQPTPEQQIAIDAQARFNADLGYTMETAYRDIIKDDPTATDWIKLAIAVIDRYEQLRPPYLSVPFRMEQQPTNIIQLPGTTPAVATLTAPIPLQSFLPGTVPGWSVQVFGKGSGGPFTGMEFDLTFSNGAASAHHLVRLVDLAAAIVMRQQFEMAHAKTEQKEGGE